MIFRRATFTTVISASAWARLVLFCALDNGIDAYGINWLDFLSRGTSGGLAVSMVYGGGSIGLPLPGSIGPPLPDGAEITLELETDRATGAASVGVAFGGYSKRATWGGKDAFCIRSICGGLGIPGESDDASEDATPGAWRARRRARISRVLEAAGVDSETRTVAAGATHSVGSLHILHAVYELEASSLPAAQVRCW